ncbi:MAG: diguanylate cyclase [Geothrix sp.]|nr:diguanylate cyclase [Geothrix sp.]
MTESLASVLGPALAAAAGLGWWRASARAKALEGSLALEVQTRDALQRALAEMEEAASHDRLTGAWNRRYFDEMVAAETSLARRRRAPLCLILLDLDHFKRINDAYGHPAGDTVLAGAVAAFRPVLRASDALVRWGGEEFMVLSPATSLEGALRLAERLRAALAATAFPAARPVTLSAGVAEYKEDESVAAWVDRADKALYQAKALGRNQVAASPGRADGAATPGSSLLELVWEEAYGSGHRLIDEQHILLFDLSNALFSALMEGRPAPDIEERLDALLIHAEKHFRDEERLLERAGYPNLTEHRGIHAGLVATARHLQEDLKAGRVDFGKLVTYLATDLVKGHLLTEDRNYFSHLVKVQGPASLP